MIKISQNRLGTKLMIYFLVAVLVPLMILEFVCVSKAKKTLEQNLVLTSSQTLGESEKAFDVYLRGLSRAGDLLSRKNEFKKLEDPQEAQKNEEYAKNSLVGARKVTEGAIRYYYGTENGRLLSEEGIEERPEVKDEEWYKNASAFNGKDSVYAIYSKPYYDEELQKKIMTVSQKIKLNEEIVGVVRADIDFAEVEEFVQNISLLNTGYVLLVDNEGNILIDNEKNTTYADKNLSSLPFWNEAKDVEEGSYTFVADNKNVYVTTKTDEITGWKLIGIVGENEVIEASKSIALSGRWTMILSAILGMFMSCVVTYGLTKVVRRINKATHNVAEGNFTEQIDLTRNDEIGEMIVNFNSMVRKVGGLITNIEGATDVLSEASSSILKMSMETSESTNCVTDAIGGLANGAIKQVDGIKESNDEAESLADKLEEAKRYSNEISKMSEDTQLLSADGVSILEDLVVKSKDAKKNFDAFMNLAKGVSDSMEKINYISEAISGITEQTNLLALNASIEAARAGEAGKGFAVVADEIRKLAEESRKSTDEIKSIVEEIKKGAARVEGSIQGNAEMIKEQDNAIETTKEVFNKIMKSLASLINGISNINHLNDEMQNNKERVIEKMSGISQIAEESASATEEVTASAEEVTATMQELSSYAEKLESMAQDLKNQIDKFEV